MGFERTVSVEAVGTKNVSARRGTSTWGHKSELQTESFVPLGNVIVVFVAKGDV
jgi:hypothetical protein